PTCGLIVYPLRKRDSVYHGRGILSGLWEPSACAVLQGRCCRRGGPLPFLWGGPFGTFGTGSVRRSSAESCRITRTRHHITTQASAWGHGLSIKAAHVVD